MLVLGMVLGLLAVRALAAVDSLSVPLLAVFYPYRQGPAQTEGITPGLRLENSTLVLGGAVLRGVLLQIGVGGDFAVTVQPTTFLPLL
jgi:hypothetical protein